MTILAMKSCGASIWLILLGILLLIPIRQACADVQDPQRNSPVYNRQQSAPLIRFASGASSLHIPFQLSSNVIFLQVRVNGSEPLWFILDTGAAGTLLDTNRAKTLGIKVSGGGNVEGVGEASVAAGMAKNVSFSLPGVDFEARVVVVLPLSNLNRYIGRVVDGVLGHDFFSRYVVEIDYATRVINVYEPKDFHYSGPGDSIPLDLKNNASSVRARLGLPGRAPIEGNFRIDTGGSHTLILHSPYVNRQKVLESVSRTIAAPSAGLGGETSIRLGRVQGLQLGRFALENVVTGLAVSAKGALANPDLTGNIGDGILRRFKVIFDYRNYRMILEPSDQLREPFESDMSGAVLTAEGVRLDAFTIFYITENSPASEAGLRVGDVIAAIDDKLCSALALDDVREMFKQSGREYLLSIKRGAQTSQVKIKLRRLI
ncbi:MAG: hypothetical protein QOH70_3902 [Blastocatellia bacterium]|jgi:hypothetical protein|nr:hypothetical protein [Blastocatellia bacterium]